MPAVLWKAIKPPKFKVPAIRQAIDYEARFIADEIYLDFLLTVSTWTRQPKFEKVVQIGPNEVAILVGTDDRIYRFVSEGTRDHYVPKTGVATMAFQPFYTAKTMPGLITSQRGGASGDVVIRRGRWKVKGIKPRNFEETIGKKWKPRFKKRMVGAMKKGAKASGHGTK